MQSPLSTIVVLGTGGTIAGTARSAADNLGYTAAQLGVQQLVDAVPALSGVPLEGEQVAQLDSKDMDHATWQQLARRVVHHLQREDVAGVVITHGTDTLEETAYFLHRVCCPAKPVVLTAAMRPATSAQADGPRNLFDAVQVAQTAGAHGVVAVLAGEVHSALHVRKQHTHGLDAFGSGDTGPVARFERGRLCLLQPWPSGVPLGLAVIDKDVAQWPQVAVVSSHAGASGDVVDALCALGVQGFVVAGTGNGTLHHTLESALRRAQGRGIAVMRASRCAAGAVTAVRETDLPVSGDLGPYQARIELMLRLLAATHGI